MSVQTGLIIGAAVWLIIGFVAYLAFAYYGLLMGVDASFFKTTAMLWPIAIACALFLGPVCLVFYGFEVLFRNLVEKVEAAGIAARAKKNSEIDSV